MVVVARKLVQPLPEGCPWSTWTRPNLQWCEENLCAYVTAPANTYSNAAYIIAGLWMAREARRRRSPTLALFGPGSVVVGVTSATYHASYTWFFQFFDFFGMYVFALMPLTLNLRRLGVLTASSMRRFFAGALAALCTLTYVLNLLDIPIQFIVLVLIFTVIFQEWMLHRRYSRGGARKPTPPDYFQWLMGILFLFVGAICSAADKLGIWCDPKNHVIQGHAAWHLLTAVSLCFIFRFYGQFALDQGMPGLPLVV